MKDNKRILIIKEVYRIGNERNNFYYIRSERLEDKKDGK
jgi:hypothetical protein